MSSKTKTKKAEKPLLHEGIPNDEQTLGIVMAKIVKALCRIETRRILMEELGHFADSVDEISALGDGRSRKPKKKPSVEDEGKESDAQA